MKRLLPILAALSFAVTASTLAAQSRDIASDTNAVAYNVHAATLRAVPFKNISYNLDHEWVALRSGIYRQKSKASRGTETRLERTWLFDVRNGAAQHALVWITHMQCGASCSVTAFAFVFELRGGTLEQIQKFRFDGKDAEAGIKFEPPRALLTITAKSSKNASGCCASFLDVDTFAWQNGAFAETAHRQVPVKR